MTILLRDDFSGSGAIAGRTPDGVNGGVWAGDAGASTEATVTGGQLQRVGEDTGSWNVNAPLLSSADAFYAEWRVVADARTAQASYLTLGYGTTANISVLFAAITTTAIAYDIEAFDGTVSGGFHTAIIANSNDYTLRLEVQGLAVRLYCDGVMIFSGTRATVQPAITKAFIRNDYLAWRSYEYLEVGSLPPEEYLRDTFSGAAGAVSAHTADSGGTWPGAASSVVLDGSGFVGTNTRLGSGGSPTNQVFSSDVEIPQDHTIIEAVFRFNSAPVSFDTFYNNTFLFNLWNWWGYSVSVSSRIGGSLGPWLQLSAGTQSFGSDTYDAIISTNTTFTVKFDVVWGERIDVYLNGALVVTHANPPYASGGSTAFRAGVQFPDDFGESPNISGFLRMDSLTVSGVTPPPTIVSDFWTAFRGSREVIEDAG